MTTPSVYQGMFLSSNSVRTMFTERSLKLDSFDALRRDKVRIFGTGKDRYIDRVRTYTEGETMSIVKEDLINIIGLAENAEHLDLIEQIILSPSMQTHFSDQSWGSVLMRLYYRMNEVDRAFKNMMDTARFGDFFMQYAAFRVLMTLLYKAQRYEELLELHQLSMEKMNNTNNIRQRQLDLLALAACARMSTPESFNIAEKIYTQSVSMDIRHLSTRIESLFVYLAINVNEPTKALNYLTGGKLASSIYLPSISLKILALAKLNRYEDIVFCLRDAMQTLRAQQKVMPQETADMLREKGDAIEDESVRQDLSDILDELRENNLFDERSLETIIFNEIETSKQDDPHREPRSLREPRSQRDYPKSQREYPREQREYPREQREYPRQDNFNQEFRRKKNYL